MTKATIDINAGLKHSYLVRLFAKEFFHHADLGLRWEHRVVLIVDELFANAVKHGSKNEEDLVRISLYYTEDEFGISVSDAGKEVIDPTHVHEVIQKHRHQAQEATDGRGLAIITTAWVDHFSIEENEHGGLTVSVSKSYDREPVSHQSFVERESKQLIIRISEASGLRDETSTEGFYELYDVIHEQKYQHFIFDFDEVCHIDTRCIGRLMELYMLIKNQGGEVIYEHVPECLKRVFDNMSVYDIIKC